MVKSISNKKLKQALDSAIYATDLCASTLSSKNSGIDPHQLNIIKTLLNRVFQKKSVLDHDDCCLNEVGPLPLSHYYETLQTKGIKSREKCFREGLSAGFAKLEIEIPD